MTTEAAVAQDVTDREIVLSRDFNAPREMVFRAWTDPEQVVQWWGPLGFTTTTSEIDVRPGGRWRFVMHGPDGTDFLNRIDFIDVVAPERLVYHQAGDGDTADIHFEATVTFEEHDGGTRLTLRSLFPTAEARAHVVEKFGAIEGGKQHLARLAEFLAAR